MRRTSLKKARVNWVYGGEGEGMAKMGRNVVDRSGASEPELPSEVAGIEGIKEAYRAGRKTT